MQRVVVRLSDNCNALRRDFVSDTAPLFRLLVSLAFAFFSLHLNAVSGSETVCRQLLTDNLMFELDQQFPAQSGSCVDRAHVQQRQSAFLRSLCIVTSNLLLYLSHGVILLDINQLLQLDNFRQGCLHQFLRDANERLCVPHGDDGHRA